MIADVPPQIFALLVLFSAGFACKRFDISIATVDQLLDNSLMVFFFVMSLKASLRLVSCSASVTSIWFFNQRFKAFSILSHACVMLKKMFIAGLKLCSGAEGTSEFFPALITISFFIYVCNMERVKLARKIQARIAKLVANQLRTEKIPGSNPGKGENFSMKINN